MKVYNIAVDGPAGAGKSTIAKKIAKKLSYVYVDTGSMYRAIGYFMLNNNISLEDEELVSSSCENIKVTIAYANGEQQVFLNGENVTSSLRQEMVGNAASTVAKYGRVRSKMVDLQQELAHSTNIIMDGRDIGTVVLPNADLKVYLTASSYVRAKRRHTELMDKGVQCDLNAIEKDIIERDHQDMTREVSPLTQATDAILVDCSDLTIEEVVNKVIDLFYDKIK